MQTNLKQTFYSNGKLLITGEYTVLDGAQAFALPTKFGQNLVIQKTNSKHIEWISYDNDQTIWFEDIITFQDIIVLQKKDTYPKIKNTLIEILHHAYLLNPNFLNNATGYQIKTELSFPRLWGLGTSSTLINNLAQWLDINAFTLLKNSFGGSGYDVACAQNNKPILYKIVNEKPVIESVIFNPNFTNNLYFVYLNQKQDSKTAITNYRNKPLVNNKLISKITQITQNIIKTEQLNEFAALLQKHEIEMSTVLESQTIQEAFFADFDGVIKSLGAWGGDFVLSVSRENPTQYFKQKGYPIVLPYADMIL